jgi:hypothetical protein
LYARSLPGSVQHTPVVFEYPTDPSGSSLYYVFIVFQEFGLLLRDDSLPFFYILNVLMICFNFYFKDLHVKARPTCSEPILFTI